MDILIENTSAQLHGIPRPAGNAVAGALVQTELIRLKPGLNKVDADAWKVAKQQVMTQKNIEEGIFRELKEAESLNKLSPTESTRYIEMIADSKLLLEWKGIEKRQKVLAAIDARLEQLDKPEPGTSKPDAKGGRRE